jgi:hypothetical protein
VEIGKQWIVPFSSTCPSEILDLRLLESGNNLIDVIFYLLKVDLHKTSLFKFDNFSSCFFLIKLGIYEENIIVVILILLLL